MIETLIMIILTVTMICALVAVAIYALNLDGTTRCNHKCDNCFRAECKHKTKDDKNEV